jgi:hypothetical protein
MRFDDLDWDWIDALLFLLCLGGIVGVAVFCWQHGKHLD